LLQTNENYPSRCVGKHTPIEKVTGSEQVVLRGRVIQLMGREGILADETGQVPFNYAGNLEGACGKGDFVELKGSLENKGTIEALEVRLLARSIRDFEQGDWGRFHVENRKRLHGLRFRSKVLVAIRSFFAQRDFIEVETPYFLEVPGQEVHIEQFKTEYRSSKINTPLYLATSPEHHMKRLLGGGLEQIFQIARCFRNDECSNMHNPEFTMVEWYRAYASYEDIMVDTEELIAYVAREVYGNSIPAELAGVINKPWPKISVYEAFQKWAGIDLRECADTELFFRCAQRAGFSSAVKGDTWDDLFHKILVEKVEPELEKFDAVFLMDYPMPLAALAKRKETDNAVAERAEVYIRGVELANGYSELNDPNEQRQRFEEARKDMGSDEALDEEFLRAMECAIPPAGGMALGVDRLVMLLTGNERIDDVIAFPHKP